MIDFLPLIEVRLFVMFHTFFLFLRLVKTAIGLFKRKKIIEKKDKSSIPRKSKTVLLHLGNELLVSPINY